MRRLQAENTLHCGGPGAKHTVAEDDPQAMRDALVEQVSYSTVAWILCLVGSKPQGTRVGCHVLGGLHYNYCTPFQHWFWLPYLALHFRSDTKSGSLLNFNTTATGCP